MNRAEQQEFKGREATQGAIRQRYPDRLLVNYAKLCQCCRYQKGCKLVPVTTRGEDCPYFVDRSSVL